MVTLTSETQLVAESESIVMLCVSLYWLSVNDGIT